MACWNPQALAAKPRVLLLDEPETGLDQEALELLDALLSTPGDVPRTVFMTTHNLDRGLALGDRVAILADGRIAYQQSRGSFDTEGFRGAYASYLSEVGT